MSTLERLQKVLSRAGVASRRKAEELILAGRVRVGGRVVTELGTRVDPERDRVELDGKRLFAEQRTYIVLHKPRAVMCTMSDPEGRPTVASLVRGVGARVVSVGRLDFHTSGVLLMTNDGDFAAVLGHPSKGAPKTYVAKVRGVLDEAALQRFAESIEIDGRATRPATVRLLRHEGDKSWIEVTLREGRNRQVRRLGDSAGFPVLRLVRSGFAGIDVEGLRPGEWRHLTVDELTELKHQFGVPKRVRGVEMVPGVHGKLASRAPTGQRRRDEARGKGPERDERAAGRSAPLRERPRQESAAPRPGQGARGPSPSSLKRPTRASSSGRGRR
ncbi:MAG: pseudouridine synthase [Polyangiaceae bacterium]|nr:pseudouridine synthase [Polyangiaceae bacterium]MCE7888696.1 rRNA pseudouridine synthase [Sorangiineae bacterium PRO1]